MRRPWVLPLLLGAGQLAAVAGVVAWADDPPDPLRLTAFVLITVVAMGLLAARRREPLAVAVILTVFGAASDVYVPDGELLGGTVTPIFALFTVAVLRPRRDTLIAGSLLVVAGASSTVVITGSFGSIHVDLLFGGAACLAVGVLGARRRQWLADRAAAARAFADADERRRRAADDERHRLAQELHDVTAHHLTSIVVTVTAAQRLADRRPELVEPASTFAAETGRTTLAALHRLVAVMQVTDPAPASALADRLTELGDGFRRLGQRVELDLADAPMSPPIADAAYGIAREALTNTLRYAPASTVHVRMAADGERVELTVTDDGAAAADSADGLGSGRGVAGMRDRAAAVGGTVEVGPGQAGWRVHAVLPYAAGPTCQVGWPPARTPPGRACAPGPRPSTAPSRRTGRTGYGSGCHCRGSTTRRHRGRFPTLRHRTSRPCDIGRSRPDGRRHPWRANLW
jgi:signal transduction histidine kinase